jgi:hypothetical protein
MTSSKNHIKIWPFERLEKENGKDVTRFPMPDGVSMLAHCDTPEELRAAQFKARSTAKGIVRAMFPEAFAGLIGK